MAVDLGIRWADGTADGFQLGSQRLIAGYWEPLAERLGLQLVAAFAGTLALDHDRIDPLLDELVLFRAALVADVPPSEYSIASVDHLVEYLHRLKASSGWSACIG